MNDKEQQVIDKLVTDILAAGYTIDMWDRAAKTISSSSDKQAIMDALDHYGVNVMVIRDAQQSILGSIELVLNSGSPNVIVEYTDVLKPLLAGTLTLAESLTNIPAAPPTPPPPAGDGLIHLHAGSKTLQVRISYVYCNICGRTPNSYEEPNYAPIRYWDPDDGWKIGTLCRWCANDVVDNQPKPEDFAWRNQDRIDDSGTDEDVLLAL